MASPNDKAPTFDDELRIADHFPRPLFEDWEEVAQKLGISPRRVSERVNYAQKLLRKMMKK